MMDCGKNFLPEYGGYECPVCGRPFHAECRYKEEDQEAHRSLQLERNQHRRAMLTAEEGLRKMRRRT